MPDEANELSQIKGNSPEEILKRFQLYVTESKEEIGKVHERAEENYKFVSGLDSQWDEADRNRMKKARIPALDMNEVHKAVEHVAGREQTARYEPRVVDRSDLNPALAEVCNEFIHQQRASSDAEDEESDAFRELCIGLLADGTKLRHHRCNSRSDFPESSPSDFLEPTVPNS